MSRFFQSGPLPEPINRRNLGDYQDENPEDFEVKNILNKFKNIEQGKQNGEQKAPKPVRQITPPPADYKYFRNRKFAVLLFKLGIFQI